MRGGWFNRTQNLATLLTFDAGRDVVLKAARDVLGAAHGESPWCVAGEDLASLVLDQDDQCDAIAFARALYRGKDTMPPTPPGVEDYEYDPVSQYKQWVPTGPSTTQAKHR